MREGSENTRRYVRSAKICELNHMVRGEKFHWMNSKARHFSNLNRPHLACSVVYRPEELRRRDNLGACVQASHGNKIATSQPFFDTHLVIHKAIHNVFGG